MTPTERRAYELDCEINQRGLPIDRLLVENAIAAYERNMASLTAQLKAATGLPNPNSVAQLGRWVDAQGVIATCLDKQALRELLDDPDLPGHVREVLALRQQAAMTSIKKYYALRDATSEDGRLRNTLQFYGAARTGRYAGRIFQPQNLPRGSLSEDEMTEAVERIRAGGDATQEELQACIRAAVRAPEGYRLVVADLANIEARVIGWIAYDHTMLDVFAEGRDIYKDYGTALLRKPYDEIDKAERHYCKPPALGCGYGLGSKGLVAYADGMGVAMTREQSVEAVASYRERYKAIPAFWREIDAAAKRLTLRGRGMCEVGRMTMAADPPWLFLRLPSGRRLAYLHPRVEQRIAPWAEEDEDDPPRVDTVTYMGVDQLTRQWRRQHTFGGKWTEQACQAIARDVLINGMLAANARDFEVLLTVHDELVTMVPEDSALGPRELEGCMTERPDWADDKLYLDAEGFESVFYHK